MRKSRRIRACIVSASAIAALSGAGVAHAEDSASNAAAASGPPTRTIDVYAVYGDGSATKGGDMRWRAYELGFGDVLTNYLSAYVVYLNEGHPLDHHRDGFAALGSFRWPIDNRVTLELSAGP